MAATNQIIKGVEFNSEPSGPRDVQMAQEAVSHTSCAESTRVHNDNAAAQLAS